MKKSIRGLLTSLLALCLCIVPLAAAHSDTSDPINDAQVLADGILSCKLASTSAADVQAWLDGPLADTAGMGAEWYALALSQRGNFDFSAYHSSLLRHVTKSSVTSASTRLKNALVLAAAGSTDSVISDTLAEAAGKQGIMSHVFALHLLNNGVTAPDVTAEATLSTLLSLQYDDGGWALHGTVSDPDVTAMVLQALAPHQADDRVHSAIERALPRLSALQRKEGDYASYGTPNPETTAQVLIALSELGIDALADARFIKDGCTLLDGIAKYRLPDGSFSHRLGDSANENATSQVFLALTAYERYCSGQPGLYLLDHRRETSSPISYPISHLTAPDIHYKPIAAGTIMLLALLIMLTLFLLKKRHRRNHLAVLMIAAALIVFVYITDFQSADGYYTGVLPHKPDAIGTVTLSIRCDLAAGQPAAAHLPEDGQLLAPTAISIAPGDTAFTVLTEAAQAFGIHMESSGGAGMRYVCGIANLYEFSCGDLSGWMYLVNGDSPSVGCDQYMLSDGDVVEWAYSLDMGGDLGLR